MTTTNLYEITFTDFDADKVEFPLGRRVVVNSMQPARNGIEAIYAALRSRGVAESDLVAARHVGSNKRVVLYGVTFSARKLG